MPGRMKFVWEWKQLDRYDETPWTQVEVTTDATSLEEVLVTFEGFLRAAGYGWPEGQHLDFVGEE